MGPPRTSRVRPGRDEPRRPGAEAGRRAGRHRRIDHRAVEPRLRTGRRLRDQQPLQSRPTLSASLRRGLGRGQGRAAGPQSDSLALARGRGAVPVDARPQAVVSGRPGPQEDRQARHGLRDVPADPLARQVQRGAGTARTTRASPLPPANTPSTSKPRASTARIRHPQGNHDRRHAVHRGTERECRDPIRLDPLSSQARSRSHRRERGRFTP